MRALARRLLPSAFALLAVPAALASESAPALEEPLPIPLDAYTGEAGMTLGQVLVHRVEEDPVNLVATVVFVLAILHTFLAPRISAAAHRIQLRKE